MGRPRFRDRIHAVARSMDRGLLPFMGPAQIGAGHPEEPYRPPADPRCPVCGGPMVAHEVRRAAGSTVPTKLLCPPATDGSRRT